MSYVFDKVPRKISVNIINIIFVKMVASYRQETMPKKTSLEEVFVSFDGNYRSPE